MSSASCPSCSEPEAFGWVEAGVVEGAADLVVGFGGDWWLIDGPGEVEGLLEREFVQGEEPLDRAAAVFFGHAAVAAEQVSDLRVEAFERAGGARVAVGDVGEDQVLADHEPDQEPGFAEPVVGVSEPAVAEQGAFAGEVPECLPPLLELQLPVDRGLFVADAAQVHHEAVQGTAGGGAGVAGQVPGGV